jgi:hypothetical protein
MTVPLDRLYNFLNDVVDQDIVIYRWHPYGSKLLQDLKLLKDQTWFDMTTKPVVICHDQEPLMFDQHTYSDIINVLSLSIQSSKLSQAILDYASNFINEQNYLSYQFAAQTGLNIFNRHYILLHSEKNSLETEKYSKHRAHLVYFWSHAIIARDWYRYAKVDLFLNSKKMPNKDFLVYNRAWTGCREYRLKFAELVAETQLSTCCLMNFSAFDSDKYYKDHQFKNSKFKLNGCNLEDYFISSVVNSNSSADYVSTDYNQCLIEVVLETMFDDQRVQLTEKSLRPIACKMPFILVAGQGSLQYLRDYGFKTFDSLWDESYDTIPDSLERLKAVVKLMKTISQLSESEKYDLYIKSRKICEYNHYRFFSDEFFNQVVDEFRSNMSKAIDSLPKSTEKFYADLTDMIKTVNNHNVLDEFYQEFASADVIEELFKFISQ